MFMISYWNWANIGLKITLKKIILKGGAILSYIITFLLGCATGVAFLALVIKGTQSEKMKEEYNRGFEDGLMYKK